MDDILDAAQTNNPNPQSVIDAAAPPAVEPPAEPAPEPVNTEAAQPSTDISAPSQTPAPMPPADIASATPSSNAEESLIVPPPPPAETPSVMPPTPTPPSTPETSPSEQKPVGPPPGYKAGAKKGNWKVLVAGIVLLLLTLPLLLVVVRQQQQVRSRATENCGAYPCQPIDTTGVCPAAGQDGSYACATLDVCVKQHSRLVNPGPNQMCENAVVDRSNCAGKPCGTTATPTTAPGSCVSYSIVNGNQMTQCTSCSAANPGTCTPGPDEFLVVCTCTPDQLDSNGYCGANCHQVSGATSCQAIADQTCQTTQLDLKPNGAGNDTWNGTINETVICQPSAGCNPPATPTPTPGGCTGSGCNTNTPSCADIKVYKGTTILPAGDLKKLKPGDTVTLAFGAAHTTKARFQINGADLTGVVGQWTETTNKNSNGEYIVDWIVSSGTTSFDLVAQSFDGTAWQ